MATGFFHHLGTFFLLVATALFLVTTITAPVVNDISIMRVELENRTSSSRSAISFGTFGYCVLNVGGSSNDDDDWCTGAQVGYNPLAELARAQNTDFNDAQENTVRALTHVMVLHPVATGFAFIALILSSGAGCIGSIFAALVSTFTFIVAVIVLATDFSAFGIVRNKVNDMRDGRNVEWGTGMWTWLAGTVLVFLATIIVLLTCCSSRIHNRRRSHDVDHTDKTYTRTTRRRFWQRRSRY